MQFMPAHSASYLPIISEMITPAILMLAAGSLVNSTLTRLARIVDRTRVLIDLVAGSRDRGDLGGVQWAISWFPMYKRRVSLVERALTMFYTAIGMFVASSLAITVDHFIPDTLPWVSVTLAVLGVSFLLSGTVALVIETHIAAGAVRREIEEGIGVPGGV
jgi:hypothetical protein